MDCETCRRSIWNFDEGQKPWISLSCKKRLSFINQLIIANKKTYSETDEANRPFVTQVYTKLQETWEHSIEEISVFRGSQRVPARSADLKAPVG